MIARHVVIGLGRRLSPAIRSGAFWIRRPSISLLGIPPAWGQRRRSEPTAGLGRSEEWLSLPGRSGPVVISPLVLSATLEEIAGLQEFARHWDGSTLRVAVVPASRPSLRGEVEARLRSTLAGVGADRTEILVSLAEHVARRAERMGKVRMLETVPPGEP